MTEHELYICRYRNGEPCEWLVLQESLVKIKQMDEVIWEGQAHELCALIEHLRSENARLREERDLYERGWARHNTRTQMDLRTEFDAIVKAREAADSKGSIPGPEVT